MPNKRAILRVSTRKCLFSHHEPGRDINTSSCFYLTQALHWDTVQGVLLCIDYEDSALWEGTIDIEGFARVS